MLLEDKFYSVREIVEKQSGNYNVTIFLNQEHPIFQAHFPGNPVTPGACMIQITKELVQQILGFKVFMQKTSNVKFTAIINPFVNSELQLSLEIDSNVYECIKVKNTVYFDDVMALKMVCLYTKIEG